MTVPSVWTAEGGCPTPDLDAALHALLAQVPKGRVTTYGRLAEALGDRVAARWVGQTLLHHQHDARCACHRAVRAGGELGGDAAAQAERLRAEGVAVVEGKVDWERYGFAEFTGDRPLERLRAVQEEAARQVVLRPRSDMPTLVGGVDAAYRGDEAVAAYCLVNASNGEVVYSNAIRRKARFPYITSYLSFRELPLHLELWQEAVAAGKACEVLLVDGSGMLHPRQVGIASHLGVALGVATVGVTKKLLTGKVAIEGMAAGESRPVLRDDRAVGVALRPTAGSRRPIFISPGHLVDLPFSEALVRRLLFGRRLPAPIYWADRLAGEAARRA